MPQKKAIVYLVMAMFISVNMVGWFIWVFHPAGSAFWILIMLYLFYKAFKNWEEPRGGIRWT
jgi:hypothetical protein